MSDQTHDVMEQNRPSVTAEYRFYFSIIFILALPFATFSWFRDLATGAFGKLHHGIVGRALTEASVTTPKIFSA